MDRDYLSTDRQGTCIAPECVSIWHSLEETRLASDGTVDYCQPWEDFMCGNYYPHGPRREPKGETLVTDEVAKALYPKVRGLIDSSYDVVSIRPTSPTGPKWTNSTLKKHKYPSDPPKTADSKGHFNITKEIETDIHLWDMVGRYYNGCMGAEFSSQEVGDAVLLDLMGEIHRPFAALDSFHVSSKGDRVDMYKPSMDTSKTLEPGELKMVMGAVVNLAKYGIFPLLRYGIGPSEADPTLSTVVIAPPTRTSLSDGWLYRFDPVKKEYSKVIEEVLLHLYGPHAAHIQKFYEIPRNIIAMEETLYKHLPKANEWRNMKNEVTQWRFVDLDYEMPEFRFNETLPAHLNGRNVSLESIDVMFELTIPKFWDLIRENSKETIRAYMLWQTFVQTAELWDMSFVQSWRDFISKYRDRVPPQPLREEVCVARVQRHFSHLLASTMMRKELMLNEKEDGFFEIGRAKAKIGPPKGCPHAIPTGWLDEIYAGAKVHSGKTGKSRPWENHNPERVANLTRPYKWTHLHDYFALEKMHWARSWSYIETSTSEQKCLHLGLSFKYDAEREKLD